MDLASEVSAPEGRGNSTAGDHAYGLLRAQILGGVYAAGTRLKEEELAPLCGVSRTPIREALRRLASEGLVEMIPRQGVRVIGIDPSEMEEIYDLRALIESHAAYRAATRIRRDQIEELRMLADRMVAALKAGPDAVRGQFMADNSRYHHIILEAAASPRLSKMAGLVVELPLTIRALLGDALDVREHAASHHHELIAAFEQGEPRWAAAIMRSHVLSAYHGVIKTHVRKRELAREQQKG